MTFRLFNCSTLLLGMLCAFHATVALGSPNLIINGDFENPGEPTFKFLATGAVIPGWTVVGNGNVHHVFQQSPLWPGNTTQFMDLTGDTGNAGIQSDTFSTIVGQTYQVTFDAFNGSLKNNGGQVGVPYNGIAFTLQGTGGDLVGYTLPAGVPESLTYFFTASSTGSSVTFMDASGYDSNAGWIDNVNVSLVAAPEPSTFALFGGGLLLMGAILRSRRAKTAHCQ